MDTYETIEYKGHEINIYYEEGAENPFESWDCEPDLIVLNYSYGGRADITTYGDTSADYVPDLTCDEIRDYSGGITCETETKNLLNLISEYAPNYLKSYSNAEEAINDALQGYYESLNHSKRLDFLAFLYNLKGIPALFTSVHGYVQGAYAEVLVIASESFQKKAGFKPGEYKPEWLQGSADLYQSWAFGDVYWYQIDDDGDTCSGFYGLDHEKSGLLEYAKNAIDCQLDQERRDKLAHTKAMIKNHVPLQYRGCNISINRN